VTTGRVDAESMLRVLQMGEGWEVARWSRLWTCCNAVAVDERCPTTCDWLTRPGNVAIGAHTMATVRLPPCDRVSRE
jgi:hypothetical protein